MNVDDLTPTLQETLALFEAGGTPLTTNEVASEFDLGRRSTYDRLDRLADRDLLATKKVGASGRVWWRPAAETGSLAGVDAVDDDGVLSSLLDGVDVGVFVFDASFHVAWMNDAVERYFDVDRDRVVGRDKRELVRTDLAQRFADPERFSDRVLATDDNTTVETFECTVTDGPNGTERRLRHHSKPIDSGPFAGGRAEFYFDVTEQRQSELDHRVDRTQLESLIDTVEEYAIFRLDEDGTVQSWNSGARRIKGYEAPEIVGEHVSTFYTDADREAGRPQENLDAAVEQGSVQREGWRVRKDGTTFWANVTIQALETDGEHTGFVKITRDMTDRREREQQLRRERDLTEKVLETTPVGLAIYRPDGTLEQLSSTSRERIGLELDDLSAFDISDLEFYDENGDPLPKADHPVPRVLETGEPAEQIVQHDDPQGRRRWVRLAASPVFDAAGDIYRVVIAAEDFTDLKDKEAMLERQRDDLSEELDEMFERIDTAFIALDDDWRFTYVNDAAERLFEQPAGELMGESIWGEFSEAAGSTFEREYRRALETQESVRFEEYYEPLSAWFEVSVYPSENGLSVYFRNVTDRKRREQELERYETVVETMGDGVYVIGETGTITMVNQAYADILGYEREEVVGMHASEIVDERVSAQAQHLHGELESGERDWARLEADLQTVDGETITAEATFALIETNRGPNERVGVVRDVTERRERERQLEQYRTIVETVEDGIYAVDDEPQFTLVNEGFCRLTGYDRDELLGADVDLVTTEDIGPRVEALSEQVERGEREYATIDLDIVTKSGDPVPCETRFTPLDFGESAGRCGVVRDVSERLEQERELERRLTQQQVVAELGQRALETESIDDLMREASRLVAETLDTDYCKVLDLDSSAESLLLRQGVGWHDGIVGNARVSAVEAESQASYTLAVGEPVVVEDLHSETRFSGPDLLRDHDVRGGISTTIGPSGEPWGILGTHDTTVRTFSETDVSFVRSVANVLASAINRNRVETELRRQREVLAALNSLNRVFRETSKAAIEQPTQEQIESVVCENLVETDSYDMVWIGDVKAGSDRVTIRTSAGDDGYLDDVEITVDPDDERGQGPTGVAFREGTMQVTRNLATAPNHEPWQERADTAGFQSSAAIPIVQGETVYGVLNVYSTRSDAFEGAEREVVSQLGEVVGHAIAATERKRALLSDEVVELEFSIRDVFAPFPDADRPDGALRIDRAVPVGDGEFLVYGGGPASATSALPDLVEALPDWREVQVRDNGVETTFELRVSEPPILSAIADAGGLIADATIEDGTYDLTVHLSPSTDSRAIVDIVQETHPDAELLRRRQRRRNRRTTATVQNLLADELTDRQRTALETAYYSGFFEWPRNASGEDIASSLDIASPTFHQHLRKAERKVLDAVLAGSVVEG